MQFAQHTILGFPRQPLYVIGIGDSNMDGDGDTITPVMSGALRFWNLSSAWEEVTTQTVCNDQPDKGSMYQQFANVFYTNSGRKVSLINCARGGSFVSNEGDMDFSWSTSGILYGAMQTKVAAALAAAGSPTLNANNAVIFINVMINDVRANAGAGKTLATIDAGFSSLISRLISDFPNVPILLFAPGRHEVGSLSTESVNLVQVRNFCRVASENNANVHLAGSAAPFTVQSGTMNADFLHYATGGLDLWGEKFARWFRLGSSINKFARGWLASLYDDQTAAQIAAWDSFLTTQSTNGNLPLVLFAEPWFTNDVRNAECDLGFMGFSARRTATYTNNDGFTFDGVDDRVDTTFRMTNYNGVRGLTNANIGAHVKITTAPGQINSSVFGAISTGPFVMSLGQNATPNIIYRVNDTTLSLGSEANFVGGNWYGISRSSTTKREHKNNTIAASTTQALTGNCAASFYFGCLNNLGTAATFWPGKLRGNLIHSFSGFDIGSWETGMDAVEATYV